MAEKKRKQSLVATFAKVAAKVFLGFIAFSSLAYGGWFGANYAGRGEPLTAGERAQVTSVFGDQLNPDRIYKHRRAEDDITHIFRSANAMVIPPTGHIDFYGNAGKPEDFSRTDARSYGLFMHEVTHCWQGQHFNFPLNNWRHYDYHLTQSSRFRQFGIEQQAEMVGDYSERWLAPANAGKQHTAADSLLARVVEDQFPQARVTRENIQRAQTAPTPPARTNGVPVSLAGPTGPRNA